MEAMRDDLVLKRSRATPSSEDDEETEAAGRRPPSESSSDSSSRTAGRSPRCAGRRSRQRSVGVARTWKFYAQVVDEQDLILLYSVCPLRVPAERRPEVSQFLTGANYGLAAGNFELDFEDGEIRYKTVLHNYGDGLDANVLKRRSGRTGWRWRRTSPGLAR